MFQAYDFIYDGIPGDEYGLMLGYVGSVSQSESSPLGADLEIYEDKIPSRTKSLFYGVEETPLEFDLSFVSCEPFSRFELEQIASSLSGKYRYCPLYICQPDLDGLHFQCILNDFKVTYIDGRPIGLECTAHCDSPFAYADPATFSFATAGNHTIINSSSDNGYLYPKMEITIPAGSTELKIVNTSDNNRSFSIKLPQSLGADTIFSIDENYVVSCNNSAIATPYECIDQYRFFRLVKGRNDLVITGNGTVNITCEFRKRVGG